MAWSIEFTATAVKLLKKIDRMWQSRILDYLEDEIAPLVDPRTKGKALAGDKKGLWRYRIGDYRVICQIHDCNMSIAVVVVGHRKDVYDE